MMPDLEADMAAQLARVHEIEPRGELALAAALPMSRWHQNEPNSVYALARKRTRRVSGNLYSLVNTCNQKGKMVEAAGIEPDHPQLTNWLMAHDFCRKTSIPSRFSRPIESPGVPSCPLESTPVVEIFPIFSS
jgi:hypothetical protein